MFIRSKGGRWPSGGGSGSKVTPKENDPNDESNSLPMLLSDFLIGGNLQTKAGKLRFLVRLVIDGKNDGITVKDQTLLVIKRYCWREAYFSSNYEASSWNNFAFSLASLRIRNLGG